MEKQKMSNLPTDRLTQAPPLTHVALDVFSPWIAVLVVPLEAFQKANAWPSSSPVWSQEWYTWRQSLSTSSFVNVLRRFTAMGGLVKLKMWDRC